MPIAKTKTAPAKKSKAHPVDVADRAAIANATSFIASLFIGVGKFAKKEAATLMEARAAAEEIRLAYPMNNRKAMIYAILPAGNQVLVPADYEAIEPAAEISKPVAEPILPTPPDFSAATHKPYRKKLDAVIALVQARDVQGLKAFAIKPTSTSPKAIIRYRDKAIAALEAA